ncbi:MAG: hypothetical protein LBF23_04200 [Endomicrobium sp.]|jgi:L-serine deaminase|nr:hypothetical protein [Endomicrobium sp.]
MRLSCLAYGVAEENATGNTIVTAPTCGALGRDMNCKFKETALGGLAVCMIYCQFLDAIIAI